MATSHSTVQAFPHPATAAATSVNVRRWSIVGLLTMGVIVAYIDRVNLSVAVIDTGFKSMFDLSAQDRGLVTSAFFWSYAAFQIPAGWLVDRRGSKKPYAIGYLVWSLLCAGTALATGFSQLFAARLMLGFGEAVMHPASLRWIRYNFREKERGLAIGVFMAGSKYGPAIGTVLAAWLIQTQGWRAMFLLMGLGGLLWLVPWLLFVPDDSSTGERHHSWRAHHMRRNSGAVPGFREDFAERIAYLRKPLQSHAALT